MKEGIEASLMLLQSTILFAAIGITIISLRNLILTAGLIAADRNNWEIGAWTVYGPAILWTILFVLLKTTDSIVLTILNSMSNGL